MAKVLEILSGWETLLMLLKKIIDNKAIINDCFNLTSGNILSTIEVAEIVKKAFNESFKKDVKILINNNGDKTVEKKNDLL